MNSRIEEKRRYLRLNVQLEIEYVLSDSSQVYKAVTKDISALGVRFATNEELKEDTDLELTLKLPNVQNPVHATGRIIWVKRPVPEDNIPPNPNYWPLFHYEVGIEFSKIEEDNKNTFLKYLCDLIYG